MNNFAINSNLGVNNKFQTGGAVQEKQTKNPDILSLMNTLEGGKAQNSFGAGFGAKKSGKDDTEALIAAVLAMISGKKDGGKADAAPAQKEVASTEEAEAPADATSGGCEDVDGDGACDSCPDDNGDGTADCNDNGDCPDCG